MVEVEVDIVLMVVVVVLLGDVVVVGLERVIVVVLVNDTSVVDVVVVVAEVLVNVTVVVVEGGIVMVAAVERLELYSCCRQCGRCDGSCTDSYRYCRQGYARGGCGGSNGSDCHYYHLLTNYKVSRCTCTQGYVQVQYVS